MNKAFDDALAKAKRMIKKGEENKYKNERR